jgi:hypothetical protein
LSSSYAANAGHAVVVVVVIDRYHHYRVIPFESRRSTLPRRYFFVPCKGNIVFSATED